MKDHGEELFELQETLYDSTNPTRRWLHCSRRDWVIAAISRWGKSAARALEVGPGSGVYLPTLATVAAEVIGIDIEDAYLDRLGPIEREYPHLRLVHDDIVASSFPDDYFDLILCSEVLEHIADSQTALKEMRRVLSPSGTLIMSTPQKYSLMELSSKLAFLPGIIDVVRWIYKEPIMETGHINLLTKQMLRQQLDRAGFTVMETHSLGLYIPGLAESLGHRAAQIEEVLENRARGTRFDGLLWTQLVVATVDPDAK